MNETTYESRQAWNEEQKHRQHLKRHKVCICCGVEYCDITKRFIGKTCSKQCSNLLMTNKRQANGSYNRTDAQNEKTSQSLKRGYETGRFKVNVECQKALKIKLETPEGKQDWLDKRKATSQTKWGVDHWTQTPEGKAQTVAIHTGKTVSLETRAKLSIASQKKMQGINQYSRCKKGKREDLNNIFFRSSWEANYARYLNFLGVNWQYEPCTFQLSEAVSYTPDFKLDDGTFVEVKGWWTDKGKRKVELFKIVHSELMLRIIDRTEYNKIMKSYKGLINTWE